MGDIKRKSVHAALAAARAEETKPLNWIPVPEWVLLEDPRAPTLWANSQRERMPKVTKGEYLAALAQHLPEALEGDGGEVSWQIFVARREGKRDEFTPGFEQRQRAKWMARVAKMPKASAP